MGPDANPTGRLLYAGLLETLLQGMGTSNGYLFHHGPRAALLAVRLGKSFQMPHRELGELLVAGVLMDVGMVGLVEDAWDRPVPVLPPPQRAQVRQHPERSARLIRHIPHLESVEPLLYHHHEWWDGSGYPEGREGKDIPFGSRILRLADTVSALGEDRPQRPRRSPEEIARVVERGAGKEFDPAVAQRYLDLLHRGEIPPYQDFLFHRAQAQAVDAIVPEGRGGVSGEALLDVLGFLIDAKDRYTGGHSRRVGVLAREVASVLGLDHDTQERVRIGGHLHDLGKLRVPRKVLTKNSSLTVDEVRMVESHTVDGAALLERIPALARLAPACRYHHERWDGAGYPERISGERIPIMAQILSVTDAYDAMTSQRSYRRALPHHAALGEVAAGRGGHFAPEVVDAFLSLPARVFVGLRPLGGGRSQPLDPLLHVPVGMVARRTAGA